MEILTRMVQLFVRLALQLGMPKCHLLEMVSEEFNVERDNQRSPQ